MITLTAMMSVSYQTTAKEIMDFLSEVPDSAKITIKQSQTYNQLDRSETTITATWTGQS